MGTCIPACGFMWEIFTHFCVWRIGQPIHLNVLLYARLSPKRSSFSFLSDKLHVIFNGTFCCDCSTILLQQNLTTLGVPFRRNGTQMRIMRFAGILSANPNRQVWIKPEVHCCILLHAFWCAKTLVSWFTIIKTESIPISVLQCSAFFKTHVLFFCILVCWEAHRS